MALSFDAPRPPMTLRAARLLLWVQATITVFSGIFVVLVTRLYGANDSVPFHTGSVSGGGAAALGIAYLVAGVAIALSSSALRRRLAWAAASTVALEVVLVAVTLYRAAGLTASTLIPLALCVAIAALVVAPETRRALATRPA